MQGRSRMAAWISAAVVVGATVLTSTGLAAGPTPAKQKVKLDIRLDGIPNSTGVEIVIKPGHQATRFKEVVYKVKDSWEIRDIPPLDVETFSADRDCSFAITVKEPGQPDRVYRRSLQIQPSTEAASARPQGLYCYLSARASATVAARTAARPVATKPTAGSIRK